MSTSSNISFGAGPERVRDPFDNKMVRLVPSGIPNSGEGVFLKKDVKKYSLVSSYLGYVYNNEQRNIYRRHCSMNVSKTDDERRHCGKYTISINLLNKTIDTYSNDKTHITKHTTYIKYSVGV